VFADRVRIEGLVVVRGDYVVCRVDRGVIDQVKPDGEKEKR